MVAAARSALESSAMKPDEPAEEEVFEDDPKGKRDGAAFGAPLGAIAGGLLGTPAGPGGIVTGALLGAAAGAAAGYGVGAGGDTTDSYWRENLRHQPYFDPAYDFDDYATAFRLGREGREVFGETSFAEIEERLREEWERLKGGSRLKWEQAREAVRGAWERAGPSHRPVK